MYIYIYVYIICIWSLFKWSCESKESKKSHARRQVQAVEPAPQWWIPCQPATQFWLVGNDGWTTGWDLRESWDEIYWSWPWLTFDIWLTFDWHLIDIWLTLIDLDCPWLPLIALDCPWLTLRFWLLRRMFQQDSALEFFLTCHRPMVRKRHTELRRPLPRQMLATGQARGF